MKCFHRKSVRPVIWWVTWWAIWWARLLKTVILCEAFRGNFKRNLGSSLCYYMISVRTCLIFRFVCLACYYFCAMLFLVSRLSIVNIFCCLYYVPGVYLISPMLCLLCVCCLLFSKIRWIARYLTCGFYGWTISYDLRIAV